MAQCSLVQEGVVAKLRRNFGFISCPHRVRDVFFHFTSLEDCSLGQLTEGTAVTFTFELGHDGKPIAKNVRLAPVGTRVRLTQQEPGIFLGQVIDPASGDAKGVIRFIDAVGGPDHLLYDFSEVQPATLPQAPGPEPSSIFQTSSAAQDPKSQPSPELEPAPTSSAESHTPGVAAAAVNGAAAAAPPPLHRTAAPVELRAPPPSLGEGQLVFFRICTDTRAAQMAREAVARGAPPARRMAYQWAVELRPAAPAELAACPELQCHKTLLELLEVAVSARAAAAPLGQERAPLVQRQEERQEE